MSTGAVGSGGVYAAERVGFGVYGWFCDGCFSLAGFGGIILDERLLLYKLGSEQGERRQEDGAAGADGKRSPQCQRRTWQGEEPVWMG